MAATLAQKAWIAPMAFWHLMLHSSGSTLFIYPSKVMGVEERWSRFPPLTSTFLLHPPLHFPRPGEDHYLSRISKCTWMLDGISEKRYEGTGRTVCTLWTCLCAHGYTHTFLPWALRVSFRRRKWTKDWEPDNVLIKSHFNIPSLRRRALKEGSSSGDETRWWVENER